MFSVTKTKERRGKEKKDVCPLLLENPRPLSPLQEPQTLSPPWEARTSYQSASCSVEPDCLQPHGLQPTRLFCPLDFPGKDTGVGCHFLIQGIFLTQGLNPGLLHCRQILYQLSYKGNPKELREELTFSVTISLFSTSVEKSVL